MNELEYAKMLEIPVSTVSVVKRPKKAAKRPVQPDLKNKVIDQINEKLNADPAPILPQTQDISSQSDPVAVEEERLETVLVYPNKKARKRALAEWFSSKKEPTFDPQDDLADPENALLLDGATDEEPTVISPKNDRRAKVVLGVEFAAACALVCGIFLTNALLPTSGINTLFAGLFPQKAETDTRVYTDFDLNSVVGDYTNAEFTVSTDGVLSFTQKCCVYPAVDGTVRSVERAEDGSYTVTIAHSDAFEGVISNLDYVYYDVGDEVFSNVPVGFSNGETAVEVSMFWQGEALNCYEVDEQNCLTWVEQNQDA